MERSTRIDLSVVQPRLEKWTEEYSRQKPPRVERKWVHKHQEDNVFVSRFEAIDDDHPDDFIAELYIDKSHPFFFEHPLDHVPGLMLIEAGRQLGTTVAHVAYDVPLDDSVFILNGMQVDFSTFAELDVPVFVNSSVSEKQFKRGALTEMYYYGNFVQNGQAIGYMAGRWHIYSKKVMARMRRGASRST